MRVTLIGSGYVGLTTGTCLAVLGHSAICADQIPEKIEGLRRGQLPIYEPGLEEAFAVAVGEGRLSFDTDAGRSVRQADVVFLAVGTPSLPDGEIDLSYIEQAARDIAPHLKTGAIVVVKSTVIAGTCARVRAIIRDRRETDDISVASNPEFLREGSALDDFMRPDRIVVGVDDKRSAEIMERLYRPLIERGAPILITTTENAELVKYAANAFLALKIGFVNEVSELCERLGGDITAIVRGMGLDHRIGPQFLSPGPGFGGSCFPKDTRAFAAVARRHGAQLSLIETLVQRNESRKTQLAERIMSEAGLKRGSRVAVLGLAFKAETDDMREAAALTIIPRLQQAGLRMSAHDPRAMRNAAGMLRNVAFCDDPYEACAGADAIVILTEWSAYGALDLDRLARTVRRRFIFDFRNLMSPSAATAAGFSYASVGRATAVPAAVEQHGGRASLIAAVAEPAR